jgi:hypothetical protein
VNQRILYYIAAALFAIAAVLTFLNDEALGVKTIFGIVMCGVMIWLGNRVTTKADAG